MCTLQVFIVCSSLFSVTVSEGSTEKHGGAKASLPTQNDDNDNEDDDDSDTEVPAVGQLVSKSAYTIVTCINH